MTPLLIGLTGRAGSGKDTVAGELAPLGYQRVAFADPIKLAAYDTNPAIHVGGFSHVPLRELVDAHGWDSCKRALPPVRSYLQRFGVAMRDVCPGVWVAAAQHAIETALADGRHVVVTDVRFDDEVRMIRGLGGLVARIVRPGVEGPTKAGSPADHVSETNVDRLEVDVEVRNDGRLDAVPHLAAMLHDLAALKHETETTV